MKKLQFSVFAMMIMALVCVSFASCGGDDDDNGGGSLNLSESQIREYLESGSGTWAMSEYDSEDGKSYTHTMIFKNGKTNGYMSSTSGFMEKYSISGNRIYISKEDQERGDFLEGGIVLTKLTSTSLEGYWAEDKTAKIIGTKQ